MDSGYTNEVSVYKLYLLGVNLSAIGRVLGQAFLRTTSPSRLRRATSPGRGGFGSPRKVNGFARGSPTRGAVERSETERLYEGEPDREPLLDSTSPSRLRRATSPTEGRPWHTGKLRLFARGSPTRGAGIAQRLRGFDPFPPDPLLP